VTVTRAASARNGEAHRPAGRCACRFIPCFGQGVVGNQRVHAAIIVGGFPCVVKAVAETRGTYDVERPVTREETARLIKELETQMKAAAKALEFEKAALIRDRIIELRQELVIEDGRRVAAGIETKETAHDTGNQGRSRQAGL